MCASWTQLLIISLIVSVFCEARVEFTDTDSSTADVFKYSQEDEVVGFQKRVLETTDNASIHSARENEYYTYVCGTDLHESSTFWESCWNSSTTNEHLKSTNKEVLIENAGLPKVQELCQTDISVAIQDFPIVPQESLDFILHVFRTCNGSVAMPGGSQSGVMEDSIPQQQAALVAPPPQEVCFAWNCRRRNTSWYSALLAYAIMGIIPTLLVIYTMVTKYRNSWIITRICRLLGLPDPPLRANPVTEKEDEMSQVALPIFVGILMPDGHTVLGAADTQSVQEFGCDGEDLFENILGDDTSEEVS